MYFLKAVCLNLYGSSHCAFLWLALLLHLSCCFPVLHIYTIQKLCSFFLLLLCECCAFLISAVTPTLCLSLSIAQAEAESLLRQDTTRPYLLFFSPGHYHLCILFWYLRFHHVSISLERSSSSLSQVFTENARINTFTIFYTLFFVFMTPQMVNICELLRVLPQLDGVSVDGNKSQLTAGDKCKHRTLRWFPGVNCPLKT